MKTRFVEMLSPGEVLSREVFVIKEANVGTTSKGDPFVSMTLADRTGEIDCKKWDCGELPGKPGDFLSIDGTVGSYKGESQITVKRTTPLVLDKNPDIDVKDFVASSRRSALDMRDEVEQLIDRHCDEGTASLLHRVLEHPKLLDTPAALKNHHAYAGGLLEHMLSMAQIGLMLCDHYEAQYPGVLSKSLVIAGCVLHDIGKCVEQDPLAGYTDQGKLVGHIALGVQMLIWAAVDLYGDDQSVLMDERLIRLKHMILSHHGTQEWGSPVEPRTPEAHILHQIDMLDSRMNMIAGAVEGCEDAWTEKVWALGGELYVGAGG